MKLKFWIFMCWIDDHINHPLWDILAGKDNNETPFDKFFFDFCQWAWIGRWEEEENG